MQRTRRVALVTSLWLVVVAAATLMPAYDALAQSGQARLSVTVPEMLVLGYHPEIRVVLDAPGHFTAGARSSLASGAGEGAVEIAVHADGRYIAALGGADASDFASGSIPAAVVVRGTSPSGRTSLSVAIESAEAAHPAGGSIVATEATALLQGVSGSTVDFATPGIGGAVVAGIALTLDLRGARNGGWHRGIVVRVTAENL